MRGSKAPPRCLVILPTSPSRQAWSRTSSHPPRSGVTCASGVAETRLGTLMIAIARFTHLTRKEDLAGRPGPLRVAARLFWRRGRTSLEFSNFKNSLKSGKRFTIPVPVGDLTRELKRLESLFRREPPPVFAIQPIRFLKRAHNRDGRSVDSSPMAWHGIHPLHYRASQLRWQSAVMWNDSRARSAATAGRPAKRRRHCKAIWGGLERDLPGL